MLPHPCLEISCEDPGFQTACEGWSCPCIQQAICWSATAREAERAGCGLSLIHKYIHIPLSSCSLLGSKDA
eukprot:6481979-Amphidinium_carterae.1